MTCARSTLAVTALFSSGGLLRVGQRRSGARSHRRRTAAQVERPDSRRSRSAVADPKPPLAFFMPSGSTAQEAAVRESGRETHAKRLRSFMARVAQPAKGLRMNDCCCRQRTGAADPKRNYKRRDSPPQSRHSVDRSQTTGCTSARTLAGNRAEALAQLDRAAVDLDCLETSLPEPKVCSGR